MIDGLLVLTAVVAALAFFGVAAMIVGTDSRDGSTDPRSQARPTGIF
jgi:hypothetical protein